MSINLLQFTRTFYDLGVAVLELRSVFALVHKIVVHLNSTLNNTLLYVTHVEVTEWLMDGGRVQLIQSNKLLIFAAVVASVHLYHI